MDFDLVAAVVIICITWYKCLELKYASLERIAKLQVIEEEY